MSSTALHARRESSMSWAVATLAALLTHALVLVAVEWLHLFDPPELRPRPQPIEFVFADPAAPAEQPAESDDPTRFSELPEDRADVRPEDPDFLSNVDSRARDRAIDDTETGMPRMEGRSESPHVALQEGASAAESEAASGEARTPSLQEAGGDQAEVDREAGEASVRTREGEALSEVLRGRESGRTGDPGTGDAAAGRTGQGEQDAIREERSRWAVHSLRGNGIAFHQEAMNNPAGNVSLFGDISLNTLNWEFAPWIQWFVRSFHRNWEAPYAYRLGLISGYEVVNLEVAKDGTLLRLDVVEQTGHESLLQSTLITFRSFTPYRPLPPEFPEPTLKLTVQVRYPDWR